LADRFLIDPLLAPEINSFRAGLGLAPVRRIFERWAYSPRRVIGLFPEWFAPPQEDWPPHVRLTSFPLYDQSGSRPTPAGLMEFLEEGEPPLVFTAGTGMVQARRFFMVSTEVCRSGGRRGVLLTQFPEQLPQRLPAGVRAFGYVPFSALFPRAAAVVHHGGIGTIAQASAAGLPQLVVPFAYDQPDNAVRVRRLGLGDFLRPGAYRADRALERISELAGSAVIRERCRSRAAALAGEKAMEQTCVLIEEM
jgi:UDP:flavonoid glycosyltransferase YjiC (YdhE family)